MDSMSIPPLTARFLIHSIFYKIIRTLFVNVKNKIVKIIFFIPRAARWMIEEYRMSLEQKLGMLISGFRTDLPLYVGAGELQSNIIDPDFFLFGDQAQNSFSNRQMLKNVLFSVVLAPLLLLCTATHRPNREGI